VNRLPHAAQLLTDPRIVLLHLLLLLLCCCSLQWDGGKDMTSGNFTSTADIDFYIDVDTATGAELVMLSDNITTRHQVGVLCMSAVVAAACVTVALAGS
jgi:hypothetical protein